MNKKRKKKGLKTTSTVPVNTKKSGTSGHRGRAVRVAMLVLITAIAFFPMLFNGFTQWDDNYYVTQNRLLRGPDWYGILTVPIVSNYHPLTILSLALNYQVSELNPFFYHLTNYLLHVLNTILVFYFIYRITGEKITVAFFTALIFGIHPMHVESVAWIAERKDVLYTFFFLLALIQYWKYITAHKRHAYWLSFLFTLLSLLSKPAAVILPLVLLLLDYWKGRPLNLKTLIEKVPFLITAVVMGILTLQVQSRGAIAGFDLYPLWVRPFFGCYTLMIYFIRFFIPYPLSAFHPYPSPDQLGIAVYLSPLFVLALLFSLWYFRKNKAVVFGLLFFVVNLLLVLQVLSIGFTIVSERYTYVPYIGLAFTLGYWLYSKETKIKKWLPAFYIGIALAFGILTFQRTKIWKDGGKLWNSVLKVYPDAVLPRINRAGYMAELVMKGAYSGNRDSVLQFALQECNQVLKIAPHEPAAYEKRGTINLFLNRYQEMMEDASKLIQLQPGNYMGYYLRGRYYMSANEPEKSLTDFNTALSMRPYSDFTLDARDSLLVNAFQRYDDALKDFNRAIALNPNMGGFYMNRSICYFKKGDIDSALKDALTAEKLGEVIAPHYRELLNLR